MKPSAVLYEGSVRHLFLLFEPVQQVEFKLHGHDVTLVADNRYLLDLNV